MSTAVYRLKYSQHIAKDSEQEADHTDKVKDYLTRQATEKLEPLEQHPGRCPTRTYRARGTEGYESGDDLVQSDTDLVAKHGEKFELVRRGTLKKRPARVEAAPQEEETDPDADLIEGDENDDQDDLQSMTVAELHELAQAELIVLPGKANKQQIIDKIREHQKYRE